MLILTINHKYGQISKTNDDDKLVQLKLNKSKSKISEVFTTKQVYS